MAKKVLITTVPFGEISPEPIEILKSAGFKVIINPLGRRPNEEELKELIQDVDYLIAGLEQITPSVLDVAKKLKLISRVGVGLDNIPHEEIGKRGLKVAYTPDAPTYAVAELAVGLLIDCARQITFVDRNLREENWTKHMGGLIAGKTVGVIGTGRIGKRFLKLLKAFDAELLCNDLVEDREFAKQIGARYVSKEEIYQRSDFIVLHLSYSPEVKYLINKNTIALMKDGVCIINTSRGQMINEEDLYVALKSGKIGSAALDVFEQEPYKGKLKEFSNAILTAHIGAATKESRLLMEKGAAEEVIRFNSGLPLSNEVTYA